MPPMISPITGGWPNLPTKPPINLVNTIISAKSISTLERVLINYCFQIDWLPLRCDLQSPDKALEAAQYSALMFPNSHGH